MFFLFGKLSKNDRDNHFWRAIDKTREIVKIIITKQNDLLILAHHRFAYIDLIAGDVETHIFFCLENGRKLTEMRPFPESHRQTPGNS